VEVQVLSWAPIQLVINTILNSKTIDL